MTSQRLIETTEGIQGEFDVNMYDEMMRYLRDKGWIETKDIIKSGITSGHALEIGPGPGYLGLEWLLKTAGTTLKALEISSNMIQMAKRNAAEYNLTDRVTYIEGNAQKMPFEDNSFDAVFSNGSLHEWENPERIIHEIFRVLKPGGAYRISDLKRDMSFPVKLFLECVTKPKAIRPGLISSINAAYTKSEIRKLVDGTELKGAMVSSNPIGLSFAGFKPA